MVSVLEDKSQFLRLGSNPRPPKPWSVTLPRAGKIILYIMKKWIKRFSDTWKHNLLWNQNEVNILIYYSLGGLKKISALVMCGNLMSIVNISTMERKFPNNLKPWLIYLSRHLVGHSWKPHGRWQRWPRNIMLGNTELHLKLSSKRSVYTPFKSACIDVICSYTIQYCWCTTTRRIHARVLHHGWQL